MTKVQKILLSLLLLFLAILTGFSSVRYPGSLSHYLIFSAIFNFVFLKSLFKPRFYFETFFTGFLWLGFWLKFASHTLQQNYNFVEAVGNFKPTGENLDRVLLISTAAVTAFSLSILIFDKFNKSYRLSYEEKNFPFLKFYEKYRNIFWTLFVLAAFLVGYANYHYGIYLRGMIPLTKPPGIIRHLIVWLLLSGFACIGATFLYWETLLKKHISAALILSLVESLLSNTFMLSRGFIINSASQIWAFIQQKSELKKIKFKTITITGLIFILFFGLSVIGVGYLRYSKYPDRLERSTQRANDFVKSNSTSLFIDRWVGLEGVMSVASYPKLGWELWDTAWQEQMDETKQGFYDSEIAHSQYLDLQLTTQHFITLPGIVAFLFYPGSILFLMVSIFCITGLFVFFEMGVKKLTGNPFLTALFAQSAAFKLVHFGYAPHQSWKYFLAFLITILAITLIQKIKKQPT